ncbi:hypothetical protein ACFL38_02135 [Candidatus Omnitrophota bacterium]
MKRMMTLMVLVSLMLLAGNVSAEDMYGDGFIAGGYKGTNSRMLSSRGAMVSHSFDFLKVPNLQ